MKRISVFYCPGGFNYEKMSVSSKLMMKMFVKALNAKKEKTEAEKEMIKRFLHPMIFLIKST